VSFATYPPRRDIAVIGLYSILFEPPIAGEVPGILSEDTFIEVFEGGLSVDVVEDDLGPVVVAALTGGPFSESPEFAGCVASIVFAVDTATFPFVLEVPLERVGEGGHWCSFCGCSLVHSALLRYPGQSHRQTPPSRIWLTAN